MASNQEELVACLGRNGSFFPATRKEAHFRRIPHLVVRVLAFDARGRCLVQCRSETRPTHPGHFTDSASGHVSFDVRLLFDPQTFLRMESIRELREETGLSVLDGYKIREFDQPTYSDEAFEENHCYVALVSGEPVPNQEIDISRTGYVTPEELRAKLEEEDFVPEARDYWRRFLKRVGRRNPADVFFPS